MSLFLHSVRWRLQLWHALILMIVVVALCMLAYRLAAENRRERIDAELENFEREFLRRIWERPPGTPKDAPPPSTDEIRQRFRNLSAGSGLPLDMRGIFDASATESFYIVYWDREGHLLFKSANCPASVKFPSVPDPDRNSKARVSGDRREMIRGGPRGMRTIVGRDISADRAALQNLAWQISGAGSLLWLLGLLGGWWLAGRAIQPITEISRTASRIAGGNVSERIDIADTDNELGRLSQVLNQTFDRLETALQRQRQFTADASHELRTPLTVILAESSRGLKRDRDPAEYREILGNCRLAAERMRSLVESLLILARQDDDPTGGRAESVDLSATAAEAIRLLRPLADERQIALRANLGEIRVPGDPRSLSMVVVNLVSNAIHHQDPGGQVSITLSSHEQGATLEVTDNGRGIAAEHLPRLFDRFYRIDPARGSNGGHSGLGLAIVKAIVENHGGTIEVVSSVGTGSTFRVGLPV